MVGGYTALPVRIPFTGSRGSTRTAQLGAGTPIATQGAAAGSAGDDAAAEMARHFVRSRFCADAIEREVDDFTVRDSFRREINKLRKELEPTRKAALDGSGNTPQTWPGSGHFTFKELERALGGAMVGVAVGVIPVRTKSAPVRVPLATGSLVCTTQTRNHHVKI